MPIFLSIQSNITWDKTLSLHHYEQNSRDTIKDIPSFEKYFYFNCYVGYEIIFFLKQNGDFV